MGESTLFIDFTHLYQYNDQLATSISDSFYKLEPFLRDAVAQFVRSIVPEYAETSNSERKEFWIGFYGLQVVSKLRELTTMKVGQLLSVSGTVTRTSEVRPELLYGTFQCEDCFAVVKGVEQQFKYTIPNICINPLCQNRRNWKLLVEKSVFVDWQRIHVQENSNEIPAGSMPRRYILFTLVSTSS